MEINSELLRKSFKKLKSSVYFDKTQLILRDKVVEYESCANDLDDKIDKLWAVFTDEQRWDDYKKELLSGIGISTFPKTLHSDKKDIIFNSPRETIEIKELQRLIDMDVEGHILGVLWLLMVGWRIDSQIYNHSYGNRIRKQLINELSGEATYSPYLFEPYFEQYESWRDTALTHASKCIDRKQDVVVLTLDLCKFYYHIDLTEKCFELFLAEIDKQDDIILYKRINNFVFEVIKQYSSQFGVEFENRNILPIGFLPSNVIANWCLDNFDKAIINGWNPVYYGRYVDDILIVDKIEKSSNIHNKASEHNLDKIDVMEFFFEQCSRWKGMPHKFDIEKKGYLIKSEVVIYSEKTSSDGDENTKPETIYKVNKAYNPAVDSKSDFIIQNEKVKIFYFKSGESEALLQCFKNNISKNKSEFRFMPEDEVVFQDDDYSEIYSLESTESLNKLRGVNSVSIDKFALSKFLGKYLRVGGLVDDHFESKFEKDIGKIFNKRTIIENYTTWEKVIEIFLINNRFNALIKFIENVKSAIDNVDIIDYNKSIPVETSKIKESLNKFLNSALHRALALNWGPDVSDCIMHIIQVLKSESKERFDLMRSNYCKTRMVDKYVMPIMIDLVLNEGGDPFNDISKINLTNFKQMTELLNGSAPHFPTYKYYPFLVTMHDLSIFYLTIDLLRNGEEIDGAHFNDPLITINNITSGYLRSNYRLDIGLADNNVPIDIKAIPNGLCDEGHKIAYGIKIGNESKSKIKCAIANVKVYPENFYSVLKDMPNRKYYRYRDLSKLVNEAIRENADILVMPESFVPVEWLSTIARTCARNQMAIITGVEHIKMNDRIYNLTAVILPYIDDGFKCAHISFHLKKHYAPNEVKDIRGYRLKPIMGNHYELYNWNDCWFPVYCCYELASIKDRSIFQSYSDMIIAVEWNSDTNYFSNILESLSRDLHCYCVQVNSSNYGDSRITKPSKSENKDIIRTKGGTNSSILVEEIDIKKLREFQLKEFELQSTDKEFKATPPDFQHEIIGKKIKNELWEHL